MKSNKVKYVIFKTRWGWFGLAGTEKQLWKSILPLPSRKTVKESILKYFPDAAENKNLHKKVQQKVITYFQGEKIDFNGLPLCLDNFSYFNRLVLRGCRKVRFGRTMTYAQLAEKIGRPSAARAVGNALAKNPLPLVISCHRIIRGNGSAGKFSAPRGSELKQKLIKHEKSI
jgi:methylated-DNA-[protein]-cysteine S-methyltransferase